MRIGELARRAGCTPRALRYYEEQGLLPAGRGANGYREYSQEAVTIAANLRELFAAGFTAEDVRPYRAALVCRLDDMVIDDDALAMVDRRVAVLDERIAALQRARDGLTEFAAKLRGQACPRHSRHA